MIKKVISYKTKDWTKFQTLFIKEQSKNSRFNRYLFIYYQTRSTNKDKKNYSIKLIKYLYRFLFLINKDIELASKELKLLKKAVTYLEKKLGGVFDLNPCDVRTKSYNDISILFFASLRGFRTVFPRDYKH